MTDSQTPGRDSKPQREPLLRAAKTDGMWLWLIGVVIVGAVMATLFALNPPSVNTTANAPTLPQTTGGAPTPPGRATTGAATVDVNAARTIPPAAPVR
jgi:hypothetical protein